MSAASRDNGVDRKTCLVRSTEFTDECWAKAILLNFKLYWIFPMTSVEAQGSTRVGPVLPYALGLFEEQIDPEWEDVASRM